MTAEHLPGCDQRHTYRQRCKPPERPANSVGRPPLNTTVEGPHRLLLLGSIACLIAVLSAALVFLIVTHFRDSADVGRNGLPTWARVAGVEEIMNDGTTCVPARANCVVMLLGASRPYEDIIRDLRQEFLRRDWSANIEPHDYSLHAEANGEARCILFYQEPDARTVPSESVNGYEVMIGVRIDDCRQA